MTAFDTLTNRIDHYNLNFSCPDLRLHPILKQALVSDCDSAFHMVDMSAYPTAPSKVARTDGGGDAAFWPDGSRFIARGIEYAWSTFSDSGVRYPSDGIALAVAIGEHLVGIGASGTYDPDAFLYPLGDPVELKRWEYGDAYDTQYRGGMRFSADEGRLFAVEGDWSEWSGGAPDLHVFDTSAFVPGSMATPTPTARPMPTPSPTATPRPTVTPTPRFCDPPSERTAQVGSAYAWLDGIWLETNGWPGLQRRISRCPDGTIVRADRRLVATGHP